MIRDLGEEHPSLHRVAARHIDPLTRADLAEIFAEWRRMYRRDMFVMAIGMLLMFTPVLMLVGKQGTREQRDVAVGAYCVWMALVTLAMALLFSRWKRNRAIFDLFTLSQDVFSAKFLARYLSIEYTWHADMLSRMYDRLAEHLESTEIKSLLPDPELERAIFRIVRRWSWAVEVPPQLAARAPFYVRFLKNHGVAPQTRSLLANLATTRRRSPHMLAMREALR